MILRMFMSGSGPTENSYAALERKHGFMVLKRYLQLQFVVFLEQSEVIAANHLHEVLH